ncbi:MAG: hypothetical protein FJY26_01485 [Betaproteobacteria bacterium]|nr:hypothetical protein [Betaproteobacteria bacterium]
MSDQTWDFAAPAFQAGDALERLRRELRGLGLQERQGRWERRGVLIAQLTLQPGEIEARRVKKPSRSTPEWAVCSLKSSADVRDFTGDLKKRLAQWSEEHD